MNNYQGWLNIYKPPGMSSFGVVKRIKKKFELNKKRACNSPLYKSTLDTILMFLREPFLA